jgi:hypothetical protein
VLDDAHIMLCDRIVTHHRHDVFSTMKPPTRGPTSGPLFELALNLVEFRSSYSIESFDLHKWRCAVYHHWRR